MIQVFKTAFIKHKDCISSGGSLLLYQVRGFFWRSHKTSGQHALYLFCKPLTIFLTMMILGPRVRLIVKMAMRRRQKTTKSMQRMILPR